jgi:hypothetical protein
MSTEAVEELFASIFRAEESSLKIFVRTANISA